MVDFTDRVAIVTGAGGGLGREHAKLLASLGAAVVVNDLGGDVRGAGSGTSPADAVVDEIRAAGGAAVSDHASVSVPEAAASIVERAVAEFGRIDVVVNNAGFLRDKTFANLEWGDLDAVLDVHLKGAFYVTRPAFAHMKAQGYGRIVVTSSASGLLGNFGQTNYGAAKMGLIGLMQVLKLEAARYGITANAVAPIAHTRMTAELLGEGAQLYDPALVSPAVAYLASEACTLSGEVWSVGGGSVSRFFVGLTPGWFRHPDHGPITVDDIAASVEAIRAEDGYLVPYSSGDEFTKLRKLLGG